MEDILKVDTEVSPAEEEPASKATATSRRSPVLTIESHDAASCPVRSRMLSGMK